MPSEKEMKMSREVPSKGLEWTNPISRQAWPLLESWAQPWPIVCAEASAATWNAVLVGTLIACRSAAAL
jgi:hypothetical protein